MAVHCNDDIHFRYPLPLRLHEFWLDTILYFWNYREIFRRFDDWKAIDRFYFIPLKLNMTYSIGGHFISMADGTIYLGTFVRNTLEHPDLCNRWQG